MAILAAGGAYVPTLFVGMYAPLGFGRSQTCPKTARLRQPAGALRSCGLLLRQAMERAETQHQINGMDAQYDTILE